MSEPQSNEQTIRENESREIDHLVSQYGKDPRRFIGTIQGNEPSIDEALLKYRTTVIAIHEGKSNGVDIETANNELLQLIARYGLEQRLEEAKTFEQPIMQDAPYSYYLVRIAQLNKELLEARLDEAERAFESLKLNSKNGASGSMRNRISKLKQQLKELD